MHRALVDEEGLFGWFEADIAIQRLSRELRLVGAHDHPDIADPQSCRRPHVHVAAAVIRTWRDKLSVGQFFDDEGLLVRRIARNARLAAERERDGRAYTSGMRGLGRLRIIDHADRGALGVVADQRAHHAVAVATAPPALILLATAA